MKWWHTSRKLLAMATLFLAVACGSDDDRSNNGNRSFGINTQFGNQVISGLNCPNGYTSGGYTLSNQNGFGGSNNRVVGVVNPGLNGSFEPNEYIGVNRQTNDFVLVRRSTNNTNNFSVEIHLCRDTVIGPQSLQNPQPGYADFVLDESYNQNQGRIVRDGFVQLRIIDAQGFQIQTPVTFFFGDPNI